ncbi:MAG: hypothetical protein OEM24_08615 [Paracoccaceae bacterium]|nr:hypothetical protein [Paracoccaceae bacterium]
MRMTGNDLVLRLIFVPNGAVAPEAAFAGSGGTPEFDSGQARGAREIPVGRVLHHIRD